MKIESNKEFAFTASGKELVAAFAKVIAATTYVKADDTKCVIAATSDKKLYVIGTSTDAIAAVQVAAKVKVSGTCRVEQDTLVGMMKNRAELEFKCDGTKLFFAEVKGRYKADISITEFDEDDITRLVYNITFDSSESLSKNIVKEMTTSAKEVVLTDHYAQHELPVLFDINKKRMLTYCFDQFHIAYRKSAHTSAKSFRMALPAKAFALMEKFTDKDESEIAFAKHNGRFYVQGSGFLLVIPETQIEDEYYEMAPHYVSTLAKMEPHSSAELPKGVADAVQNMFSLMEQDTRMQMTLAGDEIQFQVSTGAGKVSDAYAAKCVGKKTVARLDPRVFMDLYRKVKGDKVKVGFFTIKGAASSFRFRRKTEECELILIGTYDAAKD